MKQLLAKVARAAVRRVGFDIVPLAKTGTAGYPPDFSSETIRIWETVRPYTMTSKERVNSLVNAVQYVVRSGIEGAFVECGVWKGGSAMAMALALLGLGRRDRNLFLYDTFAGMSAPSDADVAYHGAAAHQKFAQVKTSTDSSDWCFSPLEEVRRNLDRTGYDLDRIHFVQGKVEDTIPGTLPREIALLRLDTDWYESTRQELTHLFPLLRKNGVLIIDDYGHWQGARRAVDEYLAENNVQILLNRIDYTGRIAVKTA